MYRFKTMLFLSVIIFFQVACSSQEEATQAIPFVPSGPKPAIEIVAGGANTCSMADTTQSTVMDFGVMYHNMGTDAYMVGVMSAPDVGVIGEVGTAGEGRDDEGDWGIYPESYKLPPNTTITLEITVYAGPDESAPVSSTSSLAYNCTTGETINATFSNP